MTTSPLTDHQALLQRVLGELSVHHGRLAADLVQFASLLKTAEVEVTTTQLLSAAQALGQLDVARREDVRQALAAAFLLRQEDRPVFDLLFDRYWRLAPHDGPSSPPAEPERLDGGEPKLGATDAVMTAYVQGTAALSLPAGETPPRTYSADDFLVRKDFATYRDDDVRAVRRHLRQLAARLATAVSRRRRPARAGRELDLRRSLRWAVRRGGEVVRLEYRRRAVRRLKLVVLCDVSGSMDVYARFFTQFLYGVQREVRGVRTFVFSTRLFDITPMLRARSFDEAFTQVAREVDTWSGGTRIGACLAEFNRRYARDCLGPRTVLVVISDGWDRGDIDQLAREMRHLRRRVYRLLWLNPLLGGAQYQPLAQGMAAALPYVDEFLPVHNLESLARVGRTLVRLAQP